jgi:hypothetical protein
MVLLAAFNSVPSTGAGATAAVARAAVSSSARNAASYIRHHPRRELRNRRRLREGARVVGLPTWVCACSIRPSSSWMVSLARYHSCEFTTPFSSATPAAVSPFSENSLSKSASCHPTRRLSALSGTQVGVGKSGRGRASRHSWRERGCGLLCTARSSGKSTMGLGALGELCGLSGTTESIPNSSARRRAGRRQTLTQAWVVKHGPVRSLHLDRGDATSL